MEGVAVPPRFFLCPISLEIMTDPVTVSSGITYDRQSIEQWMLTAKKKTCPATRQPLSDNDITPNHNLRRLIQAWCVANAENGVERIPTPKPPVERPQMVKLLAEAIDPQTQMKSLRRIKSFASHSERNRRVIEDAGAVATLSLIINNSFASSVVGESVALEDDCDGAGVEALAALHSLRLSPEGLRRLAGENAEFIDTAVRVMQVGRYTARAHAMMLLKSLVAEAVDPAHLSSLKAELFLEITSVLQDQASKQVTSSALELLIEVCPWGRNRVKAARAGAVPVLIELLLEVEERRVAEMILVVLDHLCRCAEGRLEVVSHGAGVAALAKMVMTISPAATDRAVRVLHSIATFVGDSGVAEEMVEVGVVSKLWLVLEAESREKTKKKAKEILVRHSRAWRNSPCVPQNVLFSSVRPSFTS